MRSIGTRRRKRINTETRRTRKRKRKEKRIIAARQMTRSFPCRLASMKRRLLKKKDLYLLYYLLGKLEIDPSGRRRKGTRTGIVTLLMGRDLLVKMLRRQL